MSATPSPPVGIDLGTTFSVIATLDAYRQPRTIANAEGDLITPSVVLFEDSGITVGKEAAKAALVEPDRVARHAKRDMGRDHYERPISGELVPPEVIQSQVLKKLRQDASTVIGPFDRAVVTVPAYFDEPRRKATQDAARLAGLEVIGLINEPTAAAIAFGAREGFIDPHGRAPRTERVLVYDLGGGTFDVTLMEIEGGTFRTLATAGDVRLGGLDWDRRIADLVAEQFVSRFGSDPRADEAALLRLLREAEDAKRSLTSRPRVNFVFEHGAHGVRLALTREMFEQETEPLLRRTLMTVRGVLKDGRRTWPEITRILLVGGSTRMPAVQRMLEAESGLKVDRSLAADEVVAHGAALYAGMLLASGEADRVRDVNSHSLSVLGTQTATGRPKASVLIPKNTPLPAGRGKRFKTARDGQHSVVVPVIEGGDSTGRNGTAIGDCVIRDLPPNLPAGTPVEVIFTYDKGGRLTVKARLPKIDREAVLTIERTSGMSEADFERWKARLDQQDMR
jgi:molecular chaperone DnaK